MQLIKNFLIGLVVSFLGAIPIGYLNVVGLQLYQKTGFMALVHYLLGIIFIEMFVIYATLIFANKLSQNAKLNYFIDIFGIILMFVLFFVFYNSNTTKTSENYIFQNYLHFSPFIIGLFLNCFNFLQIPFWTSTNLYLLSKKLIFIQNSQKYYYVLGTLFGIFFGMISLIFSLSFIAEEFEKVSKIIFSILIPLLFLLMGIYQCIKFYQKNL